VFADDFAVVEAQVGSVRGVHHPDIAFLVNDDYILEEAFESRFEGAFEVFHFFEFGGDGFELGDVLEDGDRADDFFAFEDRGAVGEDLATAEVLILV